jgi:hypothetical protein
MQVLEYTATCEILTSPQESDDGMVWNQNQQSIERKIDGINSRLDGIQARVDNVEAVLKPKPKSAFAVWRNEVWSKFKENRVWIFPTLAIIIGICGWFASGLFKTYLDQRRDQFNQAVDARISNALSAKGGVNEKLTSIQESTSRIEGSLETIKPFIHDVISRQFENVSKLSPQALSERLPALGHLLAVARDQNVTVSPHITADIGSKLLQIHSQSPGYWPTTAGFITYRSLHSDGGTVSPLPECTDAEPHGFRVSEVDSNGAVTKVDSAYYENCRFTIDSPKDDERFNSFISSKYPAIEFRHCLIVYRGGPFTLFTHIKADNLPTKSSGHGQGATLSFHGPTMKFVNCRFDFSSPNEPPAKAKPLLQAVLEQSGPSVAIPIS